MKPSHTKKCNVAKCLICGSEASSTHEKQNAIFFVLFF